jgi:steroid delta-isomerase-like uncharacterized protein
MTREEIVTLFERRRQALNDRDGAALAAHYSDEATVDSPLAGGSATGREAIERLYSTYFLAFPDFKFEQDELLIDGDQVAQLGRISGTDNGGFMGMSPTHRRVIFRVALFHILRDGLIVRERRIYDFTGLLIQVGVLKAKPT